MDCEKLKDPLVELAKATVESYTREGKMPELDDVFPGGLPEALSGSRAGAFVSLHSNGDLRGCIGTIEPVQDSFADEIRANAVSACSRDPRFRPVQPEELGDIEYSVDVLFPAEPVESLDELDAERYGVIVTAGGRKGLLLPDLEGVDTPEQQIAISMQKAGIAPGTPVEVERFEVVRHSE